jgi:hypothetical protein
MGTSEMTEATRRFGKTNVRPQYYNSVPDYDRILELVNNGTLDRSELSFAAKKWMGLDPKPSYNKTLFILGHFLSAEFS